MGYMKQQLYRITGKYIQNGSLSNRDGNLQKTVSIALINSLVQYALISSNFSWINKVQV